MKLSLDKEELQYYVSRQLEYRFPDKKSILNFEEPINKKSFEEALERVEYCFQHIMVRGYSVVEKGDKNTFFHHLNSDQYSQFLYYFSNSLWKNGGNPDLCSKLILLNRDLSGCWFSYKAKLPDIFVLIHPVGSVLGNKNIEYSDYLVVLQNITINGSNIPLKLGKYLFMGAGSKIIGGGGIGDCVSIGVNTVVRNPNIPDNCVVYQDVCTGMITQRPNRKTL